MSSKLTLPSSKGSTVEVSIINGGVLSIRADFVLLNPVPGHDTFIAPCYSFLIENKKLGKKALYDLGFPKAWKEKLPPSVSGMMESSGGTVDIEKDVADQLTESNVPLESINSIIWSHHHLDHMGDPSLFPKTTSLVVGPGFKADKTTYPGYPRNPEAVVVDDAFEGRKLVELDFSTSLDIGGFPAIDFFGDGSFYILKSPGHTHDHIAGLARTSEDKFVFFGGDIAHYPGEYRPTPHLPLPAEIKPSPFEGLKSASICPGALFENIHRTKEAGGDYRSTPFYAVNPKANISLGEAQVSVDKMELFDASPDVFLIIAHDKDMMDILPFFPKTITGWDETDNKTVSTWKFLKDFETAAKANKTAAT